MDNTCATDGADRGSSTRLYRGGCQQARECEVSRLDANMAELRTSRHPRHQRASRAASSPTAPAPSTFFRCLMRQRLFACDTNDVLRGSVQGRGAEVANATRHGAVKMEPFSVRAARQGTTALGTLLGVDVISCVSEAEEENDPALCERAVLGACLDSSNDSHVRFDDTLCGCTGGDDLLSVAHVQRVPRASAPRSASGPDGGGSVLAIGGEGGEGDRLHHAGVEETRKREPRSASRNWRMCGALSRKKGLLSSPSKSATSSSADLRTTDARLGATSPSTPCGSQADRWLGAVLAADAQIGHHMLQMLAFKVGLHALVRLSLAQHVLIYAFAPAWWWRCPTPSTPLPEPVLMYVFYAFVRRVREDDPDDSFGEACGHGHGREDDPERHVGYRQGQAGEGEPALLSSFVGLRVCVHVCVLYMCIMHRWMLVCQI